MMNSNSFKFTDDIQVACQFIPTNLSNLEVETMSCLLDGFQHLSHGFIVAADVETLHHAVSAAT